MKMKFFPRVKDIKQRVPWYVLALIIIAMYLYIVSVDSISDSKLVDLVVATLSVLIGIFLTAILILWQRSLGIADTKHEKHQELDNLFPTLALETKINIMHLKDLKGFLNNNSHSYESVWGYITAITNQFQSSGYQSIRDARLINELGSLTKSTWVSYARLTQVKGIAEGGIAICLYDAQIKGHDRTGGNEHLSLLDTIVDVCLKEMELLKEQLEASNISI